MRFRDFASDVACFRIMFPMLSGPHAFLFSVIGGIWLFNPRIVSGGLFLILCKFVCRLVHLVC